jgi:transposase, IS30 family
MAQHLTLAERGVLYRLKKDGNAQQKIAELMGRHPSTISRELKRNRGRRGYCPQEAQCLAAARRQVCRRSAKLEDPEVHDDVEQKLKQLWSPDQIAGRLRARFPRQPGRWLSRQAIYDWINRRAPQWKSHLRRQGRPVQRRGKLRDIVRIDDRPDVINRRRRYGDWEGDTIVGKGRRSALVSLVERKSGYTRIGRADDLTAATTTCVTRRRMRDLPASWRRSITFDNGKEFMNHRQIARQLKLATYFARPYRSWQRGTNENTNGLLRQFFPKGTDFTRISHQAVARAEALLNERPRKRLDYKTPAEVFAKHVRCN